MHLINDTMLKNLTESISLMPSSGYWADQLPAAGLSPIDFHTSDSDNICVSTRPHAIFTQIGNCEDHDDP